MTSCVFNAFRERFDRGDVKIKFIECYLTSDSPKFIKRPLEPEFDDEGITVTLMLRIEKRVWKTNEVKVTNEPRRVLIPKEDIEDMILYTDK